MFTVCQAAHTRTTLCAAGPTRQIQEVRGAQRAGDQRAVVTQ